MRGEDSDACGGAVAAKQLGCASKCGKRNSILYEFSLSFLRRVFSVKDPRVCAVLF